MGNLQARTVIALMSSFAPPLDAISVGTSKKSNFIRYVKAENDLKTITRKPVNGYQAKQRKRKQLRKEQEK